MAVNSDGNLERSGSQTNPDTVSPILQRFSDCDMFHVTKYYQGRLTEALGKGVIGVSQTLTYKNHFNCKEHQAVSKLADKGNVSESSKILLDLVTGKGPEVNRVMWESFAQMRHGLPKLDKILKEVENLGSALPCYAAIAEGRWEVPTHLKDAQNQHKEILKKLTETFELKTILKKEKVQILQLGDRYTELTIISPIRHWKLVEHELLARGKDHEECRGRYLQKELEKIRIHELFRSSFTHEVRLMPRSDSNAVEFNSGCSAVACGVPGIGKTTLVQKIIYDWASGKLYPQFQFVFSFKFRDLNSISGKVTLKQLILMFYPYLEKVLGELWKNPTLLLFIFDGFDEFKGYIDFDDSRGDRKPQHVCPDPEWRSEVSGIVHSLIQRKLLPGCSVLVTTRPTALHLLEKAAINLWVEILGFVSEERREYFNRFFEDQGVAAAVFKHVEENEILYTMSYNPSYCCILGLTLGPFFTQKGRHLQRIPKTITQLYSYYIYNILKNHGTENDSCKDILLKVGEMAFTGVSEKKIVFRNEDLIKCDLQPSHFLSGFLIELLERDDTAQRVVYTFPHLTIQEFVAALAQFLAPDPGDIVKQLTEAHSEKDGRFEVFLRFVAGLSSPGSARPLEEFLGAFSQNTTCRVIDWVKEVVANKIGSTWSETGKRNLLNTLHYLFESQNPALAQDAMGSVSRLKLGDSDSQNVLSLTPIDCAVLSHGIRYCPTVNKLDLRNCSLQYEGLLRLEAVLHKCKVLRLEGNNLGDSGVKILSNILINSKSNIQALGLYDNNLTHSCAEDLAIAVSAKSSLTELELGYNKLGDSGVKRLSVALGNPECKLLKLSLNNNNLTVSCAEDLASALCTNRSLTDLDLSENNLGDSGMKLVSTALRNPDCKIEKLRLNNNNLTASCADNLAPALSTNRSLKELDLGHNQLGDPGMKQLFVALRDSDCQIQELGMNNNGLTASCAEDLASALCTTPSLTKLELGDNNLGDAGVKVLTAAMRDPDCKIQKLHLNKNHLTASCAEDLASTVNTNPTLTELHLGENELGDCGVKVVSVALRDSDCKIQELSLNNNYLTASCAVGLASALSTTPSLTKLSLGDNNLGDSGVKLLSAALKDTDCNIQELRLNNNGLTTSCAEDLASAVGANNSLTGLYLNDNNLGDSGMKVLNEALVNPECKIDKLGLAGNGLTDSCSEDLISTLSAARPMKDVNLGSNISSDEPVSPPSPPDK